MRKIHGSKSKFEEICKMMCRNAAKNILPQIRRAWQNVLTNAPKNFSRGPKIDLFPSAPTYDYDFS